MMEMEEDNKVWRMPRAARIKLMCSILLWMDWIFILLSLGFSPNEAFTYMHTWPCITLIPSITHIYIESLYLSSISASSTVIQAVGILGRLLL